MGGTSSLEPVSRLVPGWSYDVARRDFDMDDSPDLPAFKAHGRLGDVLAFLQDEVWPAFNQADKAALRHQRLHRRLTAAAVLSGSLAVLFGIVQLVYPSLTRWSWVGGAEVCVAVLSLLVVIFGVRASIQFNWLLERYRAERLRQLKFAMLVHEDLWCGRTKEWQARVRNSVLALQQMDRRAMEAWADQDRVSLPEKEMADCVLEPGMLNALAGFYIAKRLGYQMDYFDRRTRQHSGEDRWIRHFPAWCFYGSVAAVGVHYLLEIFHFRLEGLEWLSHVLILLALALPVAGACVRTMRVARELGRSALLFRAKHAALQSLQRRLHGEFQAVQVSSIEVFRSIAACEDFLEAEQREWLRLMREAEWFG